jgi:hypothetical protein
VSGQRRFPFPSFVVARRRSTRVVNVLSGTCQRRAGGETQFRRFDSQHSAVTPDGFAVVDGC